MFLKTQKLKNHKAKPEPRIQAYLDGGGFDRKYLLFLAYFILYVNNFDLNHINFFFKSLMSSMNEVNKAEII